jgi:hypothetical protein
LRDHYLKSVIFDKKGNPVPITSEHYIAASEEVKAHTKYFIDKGYTKKKTPPNRVTANAFVSPFHSPDGKNQTESNKFAKLSKARRDH